MTELAELEYKIAVLEAQEKLDKLELKAAHNKAELAKLSSPAGTVIRPKPIPKLPKLTLPPDLEKTELALELLSDILPKIHAALLTKSVHQFTDFQRWVIGASKKSGWLAFTFKTSSKSTLLNAIPRITNISPLLEIQSRLNYHNKINNFVAKPQTFLQDKKIDSIMYAKGDPIVIASQATEENYVDFFERFQFDHFVFWQYHTSTANAVSKVAIALVFRAYMGYNPDLDELSSHMPDFTKPDIPSIRFSSGGFKDTEKQAEWKSELKMFTYLN
jgi:hypothetical protein